MRIDKAHIRQYIPQRDPFVMIDNLTSASRDRFQSDFTVLPANIFVEGDTLSELALIENIAQTSTAGLAVSLHLPQAMPSDGYIGGISKLKVFQYAGVNDSIYTNVTLLQSFGKMFLLKGECFLKTKKLLECEIKLAGV